MVLFALGNVVDTPSLPKDSDTKLQSINFYPITQLNSTERIAPFLKFLSQVIKSDTPRAGWENHDIYRHQYKYEEDGEIVQGGVDSCIWILNLELGFFLMDYVKKHLKMALFVNKIYQIQYQQSQILFII